MSNEEKQKTLDYHHRMQIARVASILTTSVIIAIAAVAFYAGKKNANQNASPIPIINVSQLNAPVVLGAQTYNWSGTIVAINQTDITLTATDREKSDAQNFTVHLTAHTQLSRWDLTKPTDLSSPTGNREPVTFDYLTPGQSIIVSSNQDSNAEGEITAATVSVLIAPSAT